ncbi:alpha/beta hydrolase [Anaerolineales bacterium]
MPSLVTKQGIVHYEVYGRGRPVILLHGWLGSWALWRETIEELSKEFRLYALDFFGFGDSMDKSSSSFSVNNFVDLVKEFMERLGIVKAPLIGHSMGGTVSLGVAVKYPENVVKVIVIGSPVNGESLNFILKLSGNPLNARVIWTFPSLLHLFLRGYSYLMAKDGKRLGKMISEDTSKLSMDSFFQSIGTLHRTDLRHQLYHVQMPILGIYGRHDIIVKPSQGKVLLKAAPNSQEAWFRESGHFPMMDEPDLFFQTVRDFLNNG